ncbi:MAG: DMT family transporter [Ignavibacteriae bacterium]|nr:DMT family transporter [Ignavibacteria bacterium]MBI3365737.1 DMT family transporter [Ignavibacteriota bacterium]
MTDPKCTHEYRAETLLLIVVVVWAANYPLAKFALASLHPFVFNAIRYIVAAAVLLTGARIGSWWSPVEKSDWPKLLGAGFVSNILYQLLFIVGLSMTTAGNSAIILSTSPLWTIFLGARMHKEKMPRIMWIGMLISLVGIVMIIVGSGKKIGLGSQELTGDIIVLAAAALWGLNTTLQKPLLHTYSAQQLALILISIGAVGLTLAGIPAVVQTQWESVSWLAIVAAILSGAFSIGIGNVIWSYGVKHLGPGRTANFNNLVPVLAFILSYFTLHEQLLPIQIIGAAITVVGVWIARR